VRHTEMVIGRDRALEPRRRVATNSQARDDVLLCVAAWRLTKERKEEGDRTLGWTKVKLDVADVSGQIMEMDSDYLSADAFRAQRQSDVALMYGGGVRRNKIAGGDALSKMIWLRRIRVATRP